MKNTPVKGFALLELLIILGVVAAIAAVILFGLNGAKQTDVGSEKNPKSTTPADGNLSLMNLGVASLDSIDVTPAATRDFLASGHKGFYVFGDVLPGTPVRQNPNYEFASVKEGTQLVAALDGVVGFIKQQPDSNDYEVFIMPSEQSQWVVGYDHVTNLAVKKGDKVKVGQRIGDPVRQGNGLLRFEFQVNKEVSKSDSLSICPTTLLDPKVKSAITSQLKSMQDQWEAVTGLELYNTSAQSPIGCIKQQLTQAESSGTSN